jgi:hypothetical protein
VDGFWSLFGDLQHSEGGRVHPVVATLTEVAEGAADASDQAVAAVHKALEEEQEDENEDDSEDDDACEQDMAVETIAFLVLREWLVVRWHARPAGALDMSERT